MSTPDRIEVALAGYSQVPHEWMSATGMRPLVFDDPVMVWLQYHGATHSFLPDHLPYEFLDFISEKAMHFQDKWGREVASSPPKVCRKPSDALAAEAVRRTADEIRRGAPVIAQPVLWWAPERIFGVPDFIVHTSWFQEKFPKLLPDSRVAHYMVLDIKFTTDLDDSQKAKHLKYYSAQTRLYSYMLGQLQGVMPERAWVITRDRVFEPRPVVVNAVLDAPLEQDLAGLRDAYLDIKLNGANYLPWIDKVVEPNLSNDEDEPWKGSKVIIARDRIAGMDPSLLYYVGSRVKAQLAEMGFASLEAMTAVEPTAIPLEKCKGLGATRSKCMRAILDANRLAKPLVPRGAAIPARKRLELFVDFEFLTNLNVDFESQWPSCDGCEMVFMIGAGWEEEGQWWFEKFIAVAEDQSREREMFEAFLKFLKQRGGAAFADSTATALYHWSPAEQSQVRRASDRHALPEDHPLRHLPWIDVRKVFVDAPCAVPGAWKYGLKEIAKALGKLDARLDPEWPGDLDEGLRAMVMGWRGYGRADFPASQEALTLTRYLEADCKALWKILTWLRSDI